MKRNSWSRFSSSLMRLIAVAVCVAACGGGGRGVDRGAVTLASRAGSAASGTGTVGSGTGTVTRDRRASATAVAAGRHWVMVWLPYWQTGAALSSALTGAAAIGTASPYWYAITGEATIEDKPGAGDSAIIAALRERGEAVVPMVTEAAGMPAFDRTLASPARRAALVRALVRIARDNGAYSGLDLDFEEFAVDPDHDAALADRAAALYPELVSEACGALHHIGRSCSLTVMPRTGPAHIYWHGALATWVYDYGALARVADGVQIMAYDEHAPGTPPGPVSPLQWVRRIVAFARATMPAGKVVLALPAYGYDWTGLDTPSITAREAPQLAAEHRVRPSWDAAQAEETFRYMQSGRPQVVWYESARAGYDRATLAAEAGFGGIAIWAAGDEDPRLWPMLRSLERGG
ncbi:MAG: glycosyl hydrolase family 18 protein [Solirubrobacteraceae bacterium]